MKELEAQKRSVEIEAFSPHEARTLAASRIPGDARTHKTRVLNKPRKGILGLGRRPGRYTIYFKIPTEAPEDPRLAWFKRQLAEVKRRLEAGEDVNVKIKGHTALHYAAASGDHEIVKMLIERGARLNAKNEDGETPMHQAATWGYTGIVKLLRSRGAKPLSLHDAAYFGYVDDVREKIEKGANVNARDSHGWMPIHGAAQEGHTDVVKMLIDSGAVVDAVAIMTHGTPLHYAASHGHMDTVELLLHKGANPYVTNDDRYTPLDYAVQSRHTEIVKLLRRQMGK